MLRKGAFDYILLETTGLADPGMFLFDLPKKDIKVSGFRTNCINVLA